MSLIVLKKWEDLKSTLKHKEPTPDIYNFVDLLLVWSTEIKKINDKQIKQLYSEFLEYYETLNIKNILYTGDHVWYSLEEIIKIDILSADFKFYQQPITRVSNILHNILIFKSNKECPCGSDNLRVYLEETSEKIIYECDVCLCIVNENGDRESNIDKKVIPLPIKFVKIKNLESDNFLS